MSETVSPFDDLKFVTITESKHDALLQKIKDLTLSNQDLEKRIHDFLNTSDKVIMYQMPDNGIIYIINEDENPSFLRNEMMKFRMR